MAGIVSDGEKNGDGIFSPNGTSPTTAGPQDAVVPPEVDQVLYSDIGITTLLSRLRQSIASARDFAAFLKKRSSIEEDHAKELKRLSKSTSENVHKGESRQGSYALQLEDAMRMHERMADNGMQFALSLHQMHEDLTELSANMEKGRKTCKHEGLDAEKKASDAQNMMDRAKSKYDGLAEDYDRAKTGDIKGSRRIMKGPKSAAQHEEDLLRKLQAADTDYQNKVHAAKAQRQELYNEQRPKCIMALNELIKECDSALTLQLQKFATFNEKLLLGNGMIVAPLPNAQSSRSLRDVMGGIDNERDFHSHIVGQRSKVPPKAADIRYEQHPTLLSKQQTPLPQSRATSSTFTAPQTAASFAGPTQTPQPPLPESPATRAPYSQTPSSPYQQQPQVTQPVQSSFAPSYPQNGGTSPSYPPQPPEKSFDDPPYPTSEKTAHGLSMPASPAAAAIPSIYAGKGTSNNQAPSSTNLPPPVRPVFGVTLEELFQRDAQAVPMVVYQCMQAVDLFGLDVEGIYRLSGTASHVQALKAMFDNDASRVDFRNPNAFYHDVNSVAGLLKQFFRDLPDPLVTRERYGEMIAAARIDDDIVRRDTLHAIINSLPDSNYATLRAVVLHLNRVQEHFPTNRMSASNIAICFAPSLLGSHTGPQIADAGLQARVLDTILANTYQIFDED